MNQSEAVPQPLITRAEWEKAYRKIYKLRDVGENSTQSTVPPEWLEREARIRGITQEELKEQYRIEWRFNSFEGMHVGLLVKKVACDVQPQPDQSGQTP